MKWLYLVLLACNSDAVDFPSAAEPVVAVASRVPPEAVSLSGGFTAAEREVVLAAVGEWCSAVGWCPGIADSTERGRIVLDHDYSRHGRGEESGAFNDGNDIYLKAPPAGKAISLGALFRVVLHEAGHWGCGHTHAGLMAERWDTAPPGVIDQEAVEAWCSEQGCH
jgi:hypothetical protein